MQRSVEDLARLVVDLARNYEPVPIHEGWPELQTAESVIGIHLTLFLDDVLKTIANIDQTSIGKMDRAARLIELEAKYGIPKTHTILNHKYGR